MIKVLAYLGAVLGPLSIGAGALAYLEVHRPGGKWNENTTAIIIGMCTLATTQLVGIMKSFFNGVVAEDTNKTIKKVVDEAGP